MKFIARLMLAAFLAAFAPSAVAFAADSGEMAAAMVLSDDAMEISDCATPCGDLDAGGSAAVCDIECGVGSFAAVLAPEAQGASPAPRMLLSLPITQISGGLATPPAKQPPRALI
ncbi:hypothetical protein [Albimonas pacifica]|uniref:hypothetical protein n=1 Tax=Albimonas pacifica TaxID=1114924 RepID=UPI000B8171DA|nr:hypothetical protein [Albimonas pacifica]